MLGCGECEISDRMVKDIVIVFHRDVTKKWLFFKTIKLSRLDPSQFSTEFPEMCLSRLRTPVAINKAKKGDIRNKVNISSTLYNIVRGN